MSILFHEDSQKDLGGRRIMLATTAYDAPAAAYTFAMAKSREALHKAGIATEYLLLSGNCHVDDARNVVVQQFLLSRCEDLVFIDADVIWKPEDLLRLCQQDGDVVGAVYPFRREESRESGRIPARLLEGAEPDERGLLEVEGLPAGFLRIGRQVLEKLVADAPHYQNRNEMRSLTPILFQRTFEGGTRWGGDLHFCNLWRAKGGKIHAVYDMRLGHVAKTVVYDSLAAWFRRQHKTTLRYVVERMQAGRVHPEIFTEAREYLARSNRAWTAMEDVLSLCALIPSDGPIIEAGSGLTTIVLAAAHPDQKVYCLEDDPVWAEDLKRLSREAKVFNIGLCRQPIRNGWYDLSDLTELPGRFSLGLNDGPSRRKASRMGFFEHFGDRTETIICDDAQEVGYRKTIENWAESHNRKIQFIGERAALIRTGQEKCPQPRT